MKEFPNGSKNKWTRIFKKKWFFPAVYIVIAAFLLSGVVWYQNMESKLIEGLDDIGKSDDYKPNPYDEEEAKSVLQQDETIKMPVQEDVQTEIVTKFYDYNTNDEEQEKAVTHYNNHYYQSTGVDITTDDGEAFDVVASLSGKVLEVKEDPLHGNVVVMEHGEDITTYYASLENVTVDAGATVEQGDQIGTAGRNLFSEENGTHVHFEIRKGDTEVNPEVFFNESLKKLVEFDIDAEMEEKQELGSEKEAEQPEDADKTDEIDKSGESDKSDGSEDTGSDEEPKDSKEPKGSNDSGKEDTDATKDLSFSTPA